MPKNIKKDRLSHLSAPINDDSEFHLRDSELSEIPKDGDVGYVCFPVKCVNHGDDSGIMMHRFVQTGKADYHSKAMAEGALKSKLNRAVNKVKGN